MPDVGVRTTIDVASATSASVASVAELLSGSIVVPDSSEGGDSSWCFRFALPTCLVAFGGSPPTGRGLSSGLFLFKSINWALPTFRICLSFVGLMGMICPRTLRGFAGQSSWLTG